MAEPYADLSSLLPAQTARGLCIGLRHPPEAAQALEQLGLPADPATPTIDRLLLDRSQENRDAGSLLCLRCRVSHPLEGKVRQLHRDFSSHYDLDLIDLATYALDDDGRPLPFSPDPAAAERYSPFTLEVLRSFRPGFCELSHWARQKLQCNNELKRYLRDHGLLLIGDWALLADSGPRQVRDAWEAFGTGAWSAEHCVSLHHAYLPMYEQAMAQHRRTAGKGRGWQPDASFLQQLGNALEPALPATTVYQQLRGLAEAVRLRRSGRWQQQLSGEEADPWAQVADPTSLADALPGAADDDAQCLSQIVAALERALDASMPAVLAAASAGRDASRSLCFWRGFAEGLTTRAIAERCGCAAGTVSKRLQLLQHQNAIATQAASELLRLEGFAPLAGSVEGVERLVAALRNHLVNSEREGEAPLLRQWVHRHLDSLSSPP